MTVEIISWSISTKVWDRTGIELATPGSAVRHAYVARHVTDCATRPGIDLRSRTNTKRCPVSSTSYDLCTCKGWSCYVQRFRRKCIYKKYLILDQRSRSHEALPSTSCDLCTCMVWSCYGQWLRGCITKKIHYLILTPRSRSQKCCPVPSSSCDLCTSKVSCCYIPWLLRRRCIYKKIHYLTLTLGSHKMLPSTLEIMWPMHQQSLILLHPKVKENMHLQENTLFDLDVRVKVIRNVAQCPLHHVTYTSTEFEVTTSITLGGEAFTRKFNIWPLTLTLGPRSHENVAQDPLHHVTYPATKFELLRQTVLEEIHFKEKCINWPWPWGQGRTKCCPVPSTSCDQFTYKVWSCYL